MTVKSPVCVGLLADLQAAPVAPDTILFVIGRASMGDGLGGFYRWDAVSTAAEDMTYLNTVASATTQTGRWVRIFQRVRTYPQGTMVTTGGVKTFYTSGVSDANGDVTVNLTDDNTPTGNALFTSILFHDARPNAAATGPATSVTSYFKALAANLKTLTYGNFKANAVTITLSLAYAPFAAIGAGTTVLLKVEGV